MNNIANQCGLWGLLALLFVMGMMSPSAQAKSATFEQTFNAKGEPASLHYQAVFTSKGAEHTLEAWRDGDSRVKRSVDDAIELYAFHPRSGAEFQLSILDKKRHIHSQVDRTNLYRIGNFTDWFDLAYSLKYPKQVYELSKVVAPREVVKPIQACSWYALRQDKQTTDICWSRTLRLPLLIQVADGSVVWRVTIVERKPILDSVFVIHDQGFVQNDVNQDIDMD